MRSRGYSRFNPISWQKQTIRRVLLAFYLITVPAYLYIGFQPANADSMHATNAIESIISSNSDLAIPSIGLTTPVQPLQLTSDRTLETPDTIVGSYSPYANKTLLIGHSSTVFQQLGDARIGDTIIYNGKDYRIIRREVTAKEDIDMYRLVKAEKDDLLVLMTCAGQPLGNRDATHRLLVTAIEKDSPHLPL